MSGLRTSSPEAVEPQLKVAVRLDFVSSARPLTTPRPNPAEMPATNNVVVPSLHVHVHVLP